MSYKNCGPKETMEYALYKGDEILSIGKISEIAEDQGLAVGTIRHLASNAYRKRLAARPRRGFHKIVVRIGRIEE